MSTTNSKKLATQFETFDIENTVKQLTDEQYAEFQKLCGKLLKLLGE